MSSVVPPSAGNERVVRRFRYEAEDRVKHEATDGDGKFDGSVPDQRMPYSDEYFAMAAAPMAIPPRNTASTMTWRRRYGRQRCPVARPNGP